MRGLIAYPGHHRVTPRGTPRGHYRPKDTWVEKPADDTQSSDNDSADGYERHENVPAFQWKRALRLRDSIYDESFVLPLWRWHTSGGASWRRQGMLQTVTLLVLNFFLQMVVLVKVKGLSDDRRAETAAALWEICVPVRQEHLAFNTLLPVQPDSGEYFNCGPLAVTTLSKVEQLDLNGDGWWTEAEAGHLQKDLEERLRPRPVDLLVVFRNFMRMIRKGVLRAQQLKDDMLAPGLTRNFTAVPLAWMQQEQPLLELCQVEDAVMCSNLEVRGMLHQRFGGTPNSTLDRDERISMCEEIVASYCPGVFGERYKLNSYRMHQQCGEPRADWHSEQHVRIMVYDRSFKYVTAQDGVVHRPYYMFLFVILLIWLAAMLEECRDVSLWWHVLLEFPVQEDQEDPICSLQHDRIRFHSMPRGHKYFTIGLNLIPRTLICTLLIFVGTQFLIRADDYNDLILNSVALGFLVEIDNMLFAAVVSDECKDIFASCEPPAVDVQPEGWKSGGVNPTLAYTVAIVVAVAGFEYYSYFRPWGKFDEGRALMCLCQVSGYHCLAAQILGGVAHLPAYNINF